jgi:glycosyltransferase involved in cell wall biosynthesis
MTPEVSVIVPTYNEEDCIDFCLSSLMEQSHKSYEVVVVDDGSSDSTLERVGKYPVKLLRTEHRGPGQARNFGASHSQARILSFLDADMAFAPEFLENLVKPINAGRAIGTFSRQEYVANADNRWARWWNLNNGLPPDKRHPPDYPEEDTAFRAILREEFERAGGYDDIGYGEDQSLYRKLGKKSLSAPGAVCYHYNPSSAAEVFSSARWYGRGEQLPRTLPNWLRHTPPFSVYLGLKKGLPERRPDFVFFKLVFDFGVLCGMSERILCPGRHCK